MLGTGGMTEGGKTVTATTEEEEEEEAATETPGFPLLNLFHFLFILTRTLQTRMKFPIFGRKIKREGGSFSSDDAWDIEEEHH